MKKREIIGLEGMKFYAFHGFYEEEQIIGGEYIVDVYIYLDAKKAGKTDDIIHTLNYESIFSAVKMVMEEKHLLIEKVVYSIAAALKKKTKQKAKIKIRLQKLNPPINGEINAAVFEFKGKL
jgi:dihydroneopterin aldolase